MKNALMTPVKMAKPKKKAKAEAPMKDQAFSRNFTAKGKPKLSAQSGDGSMGQRR